MEKRDMVGIHASEEEFQELYILISEEPSPEPESEKVVPSQKKKTAANKQEPEKKVPWQKSLLYYLHDMVFLLAIVVVVFLVILRVVVVSGTSMNNTLKDGDYLLLLSSTFYRNPEVGDVIVASKDSFEDGAPIVKRIIATEGQLVDIDFNLGVVYVDGVALDEPYTLSPTTLYEGVNFPLIVEQGCVFVLGDNRNDSKDSRSPEIGLIDCREIVGKVFFLFFPGSNRGREPLDFSRIGVVS